MLYFILLGLGFSICNLGIYFFGYSRGKREALKEIKSTRRKGILRYKWKRVLVRNFGVPSSIPTELQGTALCVVEEVDKLASQSQINVIHIEDAPFEVHNDIRKKIGKYWDTDDIEWHEIKQDDIKETKEEKIIKTPLSELVKQVEFDNIKDM